MVEEVDGIDAIRGPRSLSVDEGVKAGKINLASPPDGDTVLVGCLARLSILLFIKIDINAGLFARELHTGPGTC